jgi:hypothetical protein
VFGAIGQSYAAPQRFSFTASWRYSKSDRHYIGRHYQADRDADGSQVINRVSTEDLNFKWNIDDRWSLSASLPYQRATRSSGLRNAAREVVARSDYRADGFGDMVVTARHWMLNPSTHRTGNLSLGIGIKLPTGNDTLKSYRYRLANGQSVRTDTTQYVDRSVMPGDGSYGAVVDLAWFQSVAKGHVTFYTAASWLFTPKEKNDVTGYSVPDQYVGRLGAVFSGPNWKGIGIGLGGRLEGSPSMDPIGGDDGPRRPGYSVAIEPSLTWSKGSNTLALAVPYMTFRNRTRSVSDIASGGHGDAAFADYVILLSYSRRFGKHVTPSHPADAAAPSAGGACGQGKVKEAPAKAPAPEPAPASGPRAALDAPTLESALLPPT